MTMQFRPLAAVAPPESPDRLPARSTDDVQVDEHVDGLVGGAISDEAVLTLRRHIWPAGVVETAQAEDILAINEQVLVPSDAWTMFFVEAISEFLTNTGNPRGTLSQMQADWLIVHMDRGGLVPTPAKIALLVHLLEKMAAPATMKRYILAQIERAVITGGGVSAQECALLRRVIFTQSASGSARVDADEAELLFRIKDATLDADNAPEWTTLFVQGIANYLQSWQGLTGVTYAPRDEIGPEPVPMRRATDRPVACELRTSANGLVSAVRGRGAGSTGGFGRRRTDRPTPDFVAEQRAEYRVSADNQQWLDDRLPADGDLDPMEQALMAFMRSERRS